MYKRTILALTISLAIIFVLTSCGESKEKTEQKNAANNALKALRKLTAATEVGVSPIQYQQMLIDMRAEVNETLSVLPNGELKTEISAAADAYKDASTIWQASIVAKQNNLTLSILLDSYRLDDGKTIPEKYGKSGDYYSEDAATSTIWKVAKEHVIRASKLIEK